MSGTALWRALALAGYMGVLPLIVLWYGWLSPSTQLPTVLILVFLGTPLLFPLRGMLHGRVYTHKWGLFLALFYFGHGTVEAYSTPADRLYAGIEIALAVMWFVGAIGYVRARRAAASTS